MDLIDLRIDSIEIGEETPFLAQYFPNLFAKALIPINPAKWPAFAAGSVMASDMPEFGDKVTTPFNNLLVTKEYLETSKSDMQWRARAWQVLQDTVNINVASEVSDPVGAFAAGATSNKITDHYMDEMVNTTLTLKKSEKLNERIFKQFAASQGVDPSLVRGTGVWRQYVPGWQKGDFLAGPPERGRPLWAFKHVVPNKGPLGFITPFIFNRRLTLKVAKTLLPQKIYLTVRQGVVIYSSLRCIRFVYTVGVSVTPKLYRNLKNKIVSLREKRKQKKI